MVNPYQSSQRSATSGSLTVTKVAVPLLIGGLLVALGSVIAAARSMRMALPKGNAGAATPAEIASVVADALSWVSFGILASVVLVVCGVFRLWWERKRHRELAIAAEQAQPR